MNDDGKKLQKLLRASRSRSDRFAAVKRIVASGHPETHKILIPLLRQPAIGNELTLVLTTLGKYPGKISEKALVAFLPFASREQMLIIIESLISIGSFDVVAGSKPTDRAIDKIAPLIRLTDAEKIQQLLDGDQKKLVEETERLYRLTAHWRRKK